MGKTPPSRKPAPTNRYSVQKSVPNMATPRQPQQRKKGGGVGGFIFMMVILAGAVWLMMLIFGWGPYNTGEENLTPTASETVAVSMNSTATHTPTRFDQYGCGRADNDCYDHTDKGSFSLPDIR